MFGKVWVDFLVAFDLSQAKGKWPIYVCPSVCGWQQILERIFCVYYVIVFVAKLVIFSTCFADRICPKNKRC